jgi:nucleoside-diphosphate-sugar epimerase
LAALPASVAVTGATGFIGRALCEYLSERGVTLTALVRNPAAATGLESFARLVPGDLQNPKALQALMSGCDAVVHCAGTVRGASLEDFTSTNVDGFAQLLSVRRQVAPDARLVLLSSLAAREPEISWYARSKSMGEALLDAEQSSTWTILRPPPVYGPGDREMLPIFQWMARGIAPVAGRAESRVSLVHVSDLVGAVAACLETAATSGRCYTPDDGRPGGYDWNEMAAIAGRVWERRVRPVRLPAPLLDGVAAINLFAARRFGYAPMLTPQKLGELRHDDWVTDSAELRAITGWRPQIDLEAGLRALRAV